MYVTDDSITNDIKFFEILEAALIGGASCIQLREKTNKLDHYEELIPKIYNSR